MKTLKLIPTLILMISFAFVQAQEEDTEKQHLLEELKRDYIIEKLELSEEESKKFQALLLEHEAKKKALKEELEKERKAAGKMKKEMDDIENISEEEAKKMLQLGITQRERMLELEKKHLEAAIDAISAKKVMQYLHAERQFKRELLHMLKDDEKEHHMRKKMMLERSQHGEEGHMMKEKMKRKRQ